ncbi:MAG: rod shape-determining protein RodA, partial [Candidatus Electrothrix sp. ATG1]|nr:rod shape-determining protein RodA [Candidatus Electrothrix sp. ATG1]
VPFFLILIQPDLGTALMLAILFVSMTMFAHLRWSTITILGSTGIGCAVLGWMYGLKDYQRRRIETFLNPESDPMNHGYQIKQSKIAVGSGQGFGKGFMEGTQGHLNFLPERHTDFAFAVWCEELGFAGALFFLICFFFMLFWGINIALTARDKFGVYLAFGLVMLIFWQTVINLFMIMGMLPVVGIPLPLFSYGGSSLLTTLVAIGIPSAPGWEGIEFFPTCSPNNHHRNPYMKVPGDFLGITRNFHCLLPPPRRGGMNVYMKVVGLADQPPR